MPHNWFLTNLVYNPFVLRAPQRSSQPLLPFSGLLRDAANKLEHISLVDICL